MADPTGTVTPVAAPSAAPIAISAPAPAPPTAPDIAVPTPAPVDVTSGTPQPNQATAIQGSMAPYIDAQKAALEKETAISAEQMPPQKHQTLFRIISAIGAGLSSSGDALASHGARGGASEATEIMGARQTQQLQKQQAFQASKDAQVRQQQTIAEANMNMANMVMNMASLPNELTKSDLDVQTEAQALQENKANFEAQHGGMDADEFHTALHAPGPATGPLGAQVNPFFHNNAVHVYQAGLKVLGADDQFMQDLGKALADKNAKPIDLWSASAEVQKQQKMQEDATDAQVKKEDAQTKQQAANPLFKFESDPKALVDPGAQATLQAYIDDPANKDNLNGLAEAKLLIPKAGIAQKHDQELAAQKAFANKNAEQAANAGDPKIAGAMLAQGIFTLADLRSRGSTPTQIADVTQAAQDYAKAHGGTYNAADEVSGEQILKGSGAQTFFGSARSLVQPNGMLDMLRQSHDVLGNQKIPAFNSVLDWTNYNAGTPELADYRARVLGAADDYAKVMSGSGSPSDTRFIATENSFLANMNNQQFDKAIDATRENVKSQVEGRIAGNNYIRQREGDILQGPATAPSSGKAVSLAAARQLPAMRGMSDDQIKAAIVAQGHQVTP